ncbi:RNA polymerase sigma factor [Jiulongibacter sp. NS-SX5]|uniref:RNA polymerase sigma factor n=1 Tax=Jiulongibacter sp. NS-SX5 TaxID=3463854 RepID=UPI0040597F66
MLGVKAGDLGKMGLLFDRHHKALFGFVFRMTGEFNQSEDIVQNVFYRMIKYRHTFTGNGEFKTWMYHLTRNLLKDGYSRAKKVEYSDELEGLAVTEVEDSAELQLEKQQEKERLNEALQLLKEEHREVLILSKYQELSYKEIAEVMHTSEGNIKVKVHRAMKELKEIYLGKTV